MPPVSESQRKAMYAALEGHSTLGIPKSVAEKFVGANAHDMTPDDWAALRADLVKFLSEEAAEPEHQDADIPGMKDLLLKFLSEEEQEPAHQGTDESEEAKARARGAYSERDKAAASKHVQHREDMPESAFLEPGTRKYPVKEKKDGEWKYDRDLLLGAAREARMHGHEELAKRADAIRKREFGHAQDETIALDRASVRSFDVDGRMHVAKAHITRVQVAPYYGWEIPQYQELGLDPDRIYKLFRSPEELKKAVPTANGVQLLIKHIPVDANDHQPDETVGAFGTNAEFNDPYLDNSLTVWAQHAIDAIESEKQREISMGYHYKALMTPGQFEGEAYDGLMTEIKFNHGALVKKGRAGPEIVVADHGLKIRLIFQPFIQREPFSAFR